jgi:GH15 family glucan-1,4-alpha-glucosidase
MHPSDDDKAHWEKNRDLIVEWIDEHGWSEERGAYLMHPDTDALDASVLLHAPSGFDRGDRMSRTVDAIRDELGAGPLVFRYSGVDAEEGTFVACAFWLAGALACVGRVDEAVGLMDQLVVQSNDVGLFTEMISADDGQFLGNMPQGLSHLALVNAAITIDEMRTELGMQPGDQSHDHPRADRPGTDRQEDR